MKEKPSNDFEYALQARQDYEFRANVALNTIEGLTTKGGLVNKFGKVIDFTIRVLWNGIDKILTNQVLILRNLEEIKEKLDEQNIQDS